MKKSITTLQDALTYQLQGLFYAETRVQEEFAICSAQITSEQVKAQITKYIESADNKILKLRRVFNYLMEPLQRKNEVINKLIEETHKMLDCTSPAHLKDILMITCIQNINAYKIAGYKTAYLFSAELELATATDLIQEILDRELETRSALNDLSIMEFNRS